MMGRTKLSAGPTISDCEDAADQRDSTNLLQHHTHTLAALSYSAAL